MSGSILETRDMKRINIRRAHLFRGFPKRIILDGARLRHDEYAKENDCCDDPCPTSRHGRQRRMVRDEYAHKLLIRKKLLF